MLFKQAELWMPPQGKHNKVSMPTWVHSSVPMPRSLLCAGGSGVAVATGLMDAEPEAARSARELGQWTEAGHGSQEASVFRELPARLPSHPGQDWS